MSVAFEAVQEQPSVTYGEWLRSKQCGKKIRFHGPLPAGNYAIVLEWLYPDDERCTGMSSYECPYCGYWHIGHDKRAVVAYPYEDTGSSDTDSEPSPHSLRPRRVSRRDRVKLREVDALQA